VNLMDNVYLYNIDDLQTIADDYLRRRKEEIAECEAIIAEKVKGLMDSTLRATASKDVVRGAWCVKQSGETRV
jgi:glutamyl-tRNA reductase